MLKASTFFVGGAAWTFGRINQEPKARAWTVQPESA
jgi:putative AlgH/UPF0301 family transcriptional regulator